MKIQTVREKDVGGLKEQLADLKKERFNLRFQQATGQLEKVSRVREVRRDIARVMTVLNEKSAQDKSAAKKSK